MKQTLILYSLLMLVVGIMACKPDNSMTSTDNGSIDKPDSTNATSTRLRIRIGEKTFTATLFDNPTVTAFKNKLPLTVEMGDFNDNEKLYRFPTNLPTNSVNPGKINTGDLMLYQANTLVLFYQSFPTIYSYTKLGKIDDTTGLAAALGSGGIKVAFELE